MSYVRTRRRRQHGARITADCTKLSDGRTAMKNTDAVFVRRSAGRGEGKERPGSRQTGFFRRIFAWFLPRTTVHVGYARLPAKMPSLSMEKCLKTCDMTAVLLTFGRRGLVPFFPWASYAAPPGGWRAQRQPPALFESIGAQHTVPGRFSCRRRVRSVLYKCNHRINM